jgi:hypothetical protein
MSMDGPQETAGGKAAMNALDALRYGWGSAYEIESADGEWRARRLDGLGDWIEAEIPDDLRHQIFSDYALKPRSPCASLAIPSRAARRETIGGDSPGGGAGMTCQISR